MLMQELPQERLLIAAMAQAAAEAAFEVTREWVRDRQAFGQSLLKLQTIRHDLARIKAELAVCRSFVDQCLEAHNVGALDSSTASMAKQQATELQCSAIDRCLQLHGGFGYMADATINRAYRDARVQPIYGGSNAIMLELVARDL